MTSAKCRAESLPTDRDISDSAPFKHHKKNLKPIEKWGIALFRTSPKYLTEGMVWLNQID